MKNYANRGGCDPEETSENGIVQTRFQGPLQPVPAEREGGSGRRGPWERGCT